MCKEELKEDDYFLQTWETDLGFALPIAKIRKNGTKFIENNSSNATLHSGIYIDISQFDNVLTSRFQQSLQEYTTYLLKEFC